MLEAKWPSPQSKGRLRWLKIRNVIIGVAQFRRAIRRRSISIYSNSGSEFDQMSHTSVDSYLGESKGDKLQPTQDVGPESDNTKCTASLEERMSTGQSLHYICLVIRSVWQSLHYICLSVDYICLSVYYICLSVS